MDLHEGGAQPPPLIFKMTFLLTYKEEKKMYFRKKKSNYTIHITQAQHSRPPGHQQFRFHQPNPC